MSFHYYSCRYLPPLPSTHVCLPRGLQWRLDKNSPKINHSISQPSENNCLYFHQISTLYPFVEWPKNAMRGLLLSSYNEDGPIRQNFCKQFGASGWAELLITTIILQIFQMIQMSQALMLHVIRIFLKCMFPKKMANDIK